MIGEETVRALLKLDFFNTTYHAYLKFVTIVAVFSLFLGVEVTVGWLLGNLFFFLNLVIKNEYFDFIITMKKFNKGLFLLYFFFSLFLLVGSFGLGFIWPHIISPYAAFVGVLGFKFYVFFTQSRGGENN